MNKFKKKLLKVLILTAISASSINCFDMEQNSKNIFNNNENQYSDSDEFSIDSITPTNNINNINDDINKINNENNKFLNKKGKLENEDEKKEENISKISNDNKYNQNSEKDSSSKINNNIIEINEDKELNDSKEMKAKKRLFMEEYKKFFITYIFKKHIASEVDKIISGYIKNYNSKNDKFIYLEGERCRIELNLNLGYEDLKPIKINIWLPRDTKQKFKGEAFEDFIDNMMSNYKVIIKEARKKTIDSLKNLDMDKTIKIIDEDNFIKGASKINYWVDFYMFEHQDSKSKLIENVIKDLKNINKNKKDPCAKFFSSFKTFVYSISIKAANNETQKNFNIVKGTNIKYEDLVKSAIKRNKKEITFKDYTF